MVTEGVENATGSVLSVAKTAPSSVTKMSIVVLYKDQAGTNTLNTDLVAQVSADNGSNFTNATLAAAPNLTSDTKVAKRYILEQLDVSSQHRLDINLTLQTKHQANSVVF